MATLRKKPCGGCPYQRGCPSGVWVNHEYNKLKEYDHPTAEQPMIVFGCHEDSRGDSTVLCRGWWDTHQNRGHEYELLSVRLIAGMEGLDLEPGDENPCGVPVFASGAEAAKHGTKDIKKPKDKAKRLQDKLLAKHPDLKTK